MAAFAPDGDAARQGRRFDGCEIFHPKNAFRISSSENAQDGFKFVFRNRFWPDSSCHRLCPLFEANNGWVVPLTYVKAPREVVVYSFERFIADSTRFWTLITFVATVGIVTGFAVPLAASYQSQKYYQPAPSQIPASAVLVIPTIAPPPELAQQLSERDIEMGRLAARNRRLEALVEALRKKSQTSGERPQD